MFRSVPVQQTQDKTVLPYMLQLPYKSVADPGSVQIQLYLTRHEVSGLLLNWQGYKLIPDATGLTNQDTTENLLRIKLIRSNGNNNKDK